MQFHGATSGSCPESHLEQMLRDRNCSVRISRIEWKEVKKKRELKAVFEIMANLAGDVEALEHVDDDTPKAHVSKQMKVGFDGDGISIGSPKKIDDLAKSSTEDPLGRLEMKRQLVTEAQSSRVVDDQREK